LIDVLQRTLLLTRQDTDEEKVAKVERVLSLYDMQSHAIVYRTTVVTDMAGIATHPHAAKTEERMLQAMLQLLLAGRTASHRLGMGRLALGGPVVVGISVSADHQLPTSKLLLVTPSRVYPPWKPRSHISQLVLNVGQKRSRR
jgi:hypothetical protein